MASIANGVTLVWTGTHAGIPSGWERVTALDAKHPKGWGDENPNTSGGSNTHTHTASSHTHTMDAHTHSVALATFSGPGDATGNTSGSGSDNHSHGAASIGNLSGGGLQGTVVTWQSANHEPPYYTVIFITPTVSAAIADDVIGFWNDATAPGGFAHCDGNNGTVDLRDKYLKGANTSADAGDTGGGTSHQHTVSHSHTESGHTHSGTSATKTGANRQNGSGKTASHEGHTHTITLNSNTAGAQTYTKTDAGSGDTVEVAYTKVAYVQNISGGNIVPPKGIIAMWTDTVASIPRGWVVCDGTNNTPDLRNKFIKCITTTGQIGDTGGSNTHTHSAVSHTHTASGTHTHSGSSAQSGSTQAINGGSDGYAISTHTHTLASVSNETATWGNTDIDCDTVSNQPAYLTVAYIQFTGTTVGSSLLVAMAMA